MVVRGRVGDAEHGIDLGEEWHRLRIRVACHVEQQLVGARRELRRLPTRRRYLG